MTTVIGISNVNGSVDWSRLVASGIQGAYIKLSEGVTFDDRDSYGHARSADRAELPFGYYHFAHPDHNAPKAEVQHVLRRLSGRKPKPSLRLVLDFEQGKAEPSYGDWTHRFSQLFET